MGDSALLATLTYIAAAVLALGSSIGVSAIAVIRAAAKGAHTQQEFIAAASTVWVLLATVLVSQCAMVGVVLSAWWSTGTKFRERIGFTAPRVTVVQGLVVLVAGGVPFALSIGAASLLPSLMASGEAISGLWSDTPLGASILWVITIGLFPGFTEEMLFRGMIQRGYMRRLSPIAAILLTSVLFALLHVDPPAMGLAFILGIWFGVVAWRTGSIVLTVLTHFTVNAGWNAGQMVVLQRGIDQSTVILVVSIVGAISLVAFVMAIPILVRAGRRGGEATMGSGG